MEEIVVAGEATLGAVGDVEDVLPRASSPEHVVFEPHVLAAATNLHRVRAQLHHGVVREGEHPAAGLHVLQQHATVAVVIDEAVRDEVVAVVSLRMNAGRVIVGDDAGDAPLAVGEIEAGANIPINPRVAQRAATPVDSRRILPRREVVSVADERAVGRVEAGAVVVRVQIVKLRVAAQLEAGGVAEGQVVMHPRHLRPRRVIVVEAASVVVGDIATGLEAGRDDRQPDVGVVEEEVLAHDGSEAGVFQVDAEIAPAMDVIGMVAQDGGGLRPGEEAVILISARPGADVAVEEIIANDGGEGGRIDDLQAGVGVFIDAGMLEGEGDGAIVDVDAVIPAGDGEVGKGDGVGIVQLEDELTAGDIRPVEDGALLGGGVVVGGHALGREDAVVDRGFIVAAGVVVIDGPVAAGDEVAGAGDVSRWGDCAGGDEQAVLVDTGRAGAIDGGDDVLPFVELEHATGGQDRARRGVVEDLQGEVVVRAGPRQEDVVAGLPIAEVEEPGIVVGLRGIYPDFQGESGGEVRKAIGQIEVVVHAVEPDGGVVRSGNARGLAEDGAVHVGAVESAAARIHRRGAAGFSKAIVGEGGIFEHAVRIELAEGGRAVGAADDDAGIRVGDADAGGQEVVAGIDEDGVAKLQVVGLQNGADAGLRGRGGEAVIRIIADGGGEHVAERDGVVHVVIGDGREDAEHGIGRVGDGGSGDGADADDVLIGDGIGGLRDVPEVGAVVGFVGGEVLIWPGQSDGGILDADVAREAIGAPADFVVGLLRETIPAVGVRHQDILGRALGGGGGVAVGAEVHVAAVLLGFEIEGIAGTTAINGRAAGGVVGVTQAGLEAAKRGAFVEIIIRAVGDRRRGGELVREEQLAIAGGEGRHPLQARTGEPAVVRHLINDGHESGRSDVERVALLGRAGAVLNDDRASNGEPLRALGVEVEGMAASGGKVQPTGPASRPIVVRQHAFRHAEAFEVHLAVDACDRRDAEGGRQGVPDVIRRRQTLHVGRAEHAVRAIDIDEQRGGAEAVAVAEIRELPRGQGGAVTLPVADLAGAGGVEQVVVAREVGLTFVADAHAVTALHPDDVIPQMNIVRRRRVDAIRRGLVDGVIEDLVCTRPELRQANRRNAMVVKQVVGNRFRAAGVGLAVNAILVRVNRVPRKRHRNVWRINAKAHVRINAAADHLPLPEDDAVVISVNFRVPHVQHRSAREGVDTITDVVVNG